MSHVTFGKDSYLLVGVVTTAGTVGVDLGIRKMAEHGRWGLTSHIGCHISQDSYMRKKKQPSSAIHYYFGSLF